ncbi:anticodon nuclease [Prevotella sp.]|uniref:anticodon nuclease n=1 Tax=Prevotella sp. TaxID=59823 RepID=UPI003DA2122A
MGKSLTEVAQKLQKNENKVQLIYAFNGTGKTRLSRAYKELISSDEEDEAPQQKILYYNAFTEDLFYWDNDLVEDANRTLIIRDNSFTNWVLNEQGQEDKIKTNFQRYTNDKLTPNFNKDYNEVSFSVEGGNENKIENIKISKGEESCFVWCVFYSLLLEVQATLKESNPENKSTTIFDKLEYIFIDDPVSSLDENHLIELAVDIAELIGKCPKKLKFIITTHNALFYNVLYNELGLNQGYLLGKNEDGTFNLEEKKGASNKSFSYHLFIKKTIEEAIQTNSIQRYHFTLLRNLYEKTANFLGYPRWSELLPDDKKVYYKRITNFASHSTLSNETVAEPTEPEKQTVKLLLTHLKENYNFWEEE